MKDKKHIDRLFQESFKDFDVTPRDEVWQNIEIELNKKKKKRRIIPIWWQYSGVAALILLLLTIGGFYLNSPIQNFNNPIVDIEQTPDNQPKTIDNNKSSNLNTAPKPPTLTSNDTAEHSLNNSTINNKKTEAENKNPFKTPSKSKLATSSNAINAREQNNTLPGKKSNKKYNSKNASINATYAQNAPKKEVNIYNPETLKTPNTVNSNFSDTITNLNKTAIAFEKEKNDIGDNLSQNNLNVATLERDKKTNATDHDALKSNNLSIEEAIEKNEVVLATNEKTSKWSIAPNAAPVYFNTMGGDGSSIDPQFNSNSKSGDINMSYGITTSYALNKKIKIRSGISKVNLGYKTNDVVTFQALGFNSRNNLQNISPIPGNPVVSGASDFSIISADAIDSNSVPEALISSNTSINQSLGYIEVPLEIQYTISDKKLGLNLIGGFSSFFLNNNEIYSENSNGTITLLGEANNLNNLSYSANLGLGVSYKVGKQIDLNLEPMFKYQFNTFNNTSGNFTPYFIGVYTGFAIKF